MSEGEGKVLADFRVGQVFRSRLGRTITDADNVWFTCLTLNTNQSHFNRVYAEQTRFGRPLVNSCLTLALATGLSVADTSEHAVANLSWSDVQLPVPVFVGDTLWAETEVLELRPSRSNPAVGVVTVRTRGVNQWGEVVIKFDRKFMVHQEPRAVPSTFPTVIDEPTNDSVTSSR